MATQTGSIDLRGANSAKLYVDDEAGKIRTEVGETYATKAEVQRTGTGEGTVVSSDDAAPLPPLSIHIDGKSVQDGTPSPSAPIPIKSVESRNLFDAAAATTKRFINKSNGTVGTSNGWSASDFIGVHGGASYILSGVENGWSGIAGAAWYDAGKAYLSGESSTTNPITAPSNAAYVRISVMTEDPSAVQFELGSTATEYQPYGSISIASHSENIAGDLFDGYINASGVMQVQTASVEKTIPLMPVLGSEISLAVYGTTADMTSTSTGGWCRAVWYDEGMNLLSSITDGTRAHYDYTATSFVKQEPVQVPSGARFFVLSFRTYGGTPVVVFDGEAYESLVYSGTSTPIDLQGNAARSLPDGTRDALDVVDGRLVLTKRVERYEVPTDDGGWSIVNGLLVHSRGNIPSYIGWVKPKMCNVQSLYNVSTGGTQIQIKPDGTTVDEFVTAMNGQPVVLLVALAEPQTIDLGTIELPALPSPSFSMYTDAMVTPTMGAEWWTLGGEEVGSVYQRTSALEQDVDGLTLELSGKVDSSEEWVSWLHAGTDATTHEPYLAMGKDSDYPSVVYGSDAARFYDGEGDAAANVVASFGADGARIGRIGEAHQTQTPTQSLVYGPDGKLVIVTRYQPNTDISGNLKYGTRITNAANMSFVDIRPATSSGEFIDQLDLSVDMNDINLSTTSGSELHLDNTYASIKAKETVSGTTYNNGLLLGFDSQNGYAPIISFSGTGAQAAWLAALGMGTETIYEDATVTVKRFGRMVIVQCHGITATPSSGSPIAGIDLSACKPSYNASALVANALTSGHIARMWVSATDGKVYLNAVNSTASDAWYGTLTYIY